MCMCPRCGIEIPVNIVVDEEGNECEQYLCDDCGDYYDIDGKEIE